MLCFLERRNLGRSETSENPDNLLAMASKLRAMAFKLPAMACNLEAMASTLLALC